MNTSLDRYARASLKRALRQFLIAALSFILNCALIVPFLYGFPLYKYWDAIGQYLVYLAMVQIVVFCLYMGKAYIAWQGLRDLQKGRIPFE